MNKITLGLVLVLVVVLNLITGIDSKIGGRYQDMPERCVMPMDMGYCRAKMKRYFFNTNRNQCALFYFGGCAGNANNFETMEECDALCGNKELVYEE